MTGSTLYQSILGSQFADLCPVLRQFHSAHAPATATGRLTIQRGRSRLARFIAWLVGLPRESAGLDLTLRVRSQGKSEIWERTFGSEKLITRQWQTGDLLLESYGLMTIGLAVRSVDGALEMTTRRVWWCGLPVPACTAPRVDAIALPAEQGWQIRVQVAVPLVGPLLTYYGEVHPT